MVYHWKSFVKLCYKDIVMSKNNVIRSFYILLHLRFLEKSAVLDSVVLFSVASDISSRETITWDVFSKDGSVF